MHKTRFNFFCSEPKRKKGLRLESFYKSIIVESNKFTASNNECSSVYDTWGF